MGAWGGCGGSAVVGGRGGGPAMRGLQLPWSCRTVCFQIVVAHGGVPFPGEKRGPMSDNHVWPEASADYAVTTVPDCNLHSFCRGSKCQSNEAVQSASWTKLPQ